MPPGGSLLLRRKKRYEKTDFKMNSTYKIGLGNRRKKSIASILKVRGSPTNYLVSGKSGTIWRSNWRMLVDVNTATASCFTTTCSYCTRSISTNILWLYPSKHFNETNNIAGTNSDQKLQHMPYGKQHDTQALVFFARAFVNHGNIFFRFWSRIWVTSGLSLTLTLNILEVPKATPEHCFWTCWLIGCYATRELSR